MLTLPPEERILLLCGRQHLTEPGLQELRALLKGAVDQDRLLALARQHRLLSFLYHHLQQEEGAREVAGAVLSEAQRAFFGNALRNLKIFKELASVLRRLEKAGVRVVLLKGAYLANAVYENGALRPFEDVDLFCRKEDFPAIKEAMLGAGYVLPDSLVDEQFYLEHHFHIPLIHPGKGLCLEFHWQLLDEYKQGAVPLDRLWEDLTPVSVGGEATGFGLEPLNQLLYLALHADKHGYMNRFILGHPDLPRIVLDPVSGNRLIWFVDILESIERARTVPDWDALAGRIRAWGVEKSAVATLSILERLFEWEEGRRILARFPEVRPNRIQRSLYGLVAGVLSKGKGPGYRLAAWAVRMDKTTQIRPIRMLDAFEILFPPRWEVRSRYRLKSAGSVFRMYPVHFFRELTRGVSHVVVFLVQRLKRKKNPGPAPPGEGL